MLQELHISKPVEEFVINFLYGFDCHEELGGSSIYNLTWKYGFIATLIEFGSNEIAYMESSSGFHLSYHQEALVNDDARRYWSFQH